MKSRDKNKEEELDLSQRDVADILGIKQASVSRLERNAVENFKKKLRARYGDIKDVLPD